MSLLSVDQAVLVVIDVQEGFRAHLFNTAALQKTLNQLIAGCVALCVPVLVTEQYPKGLGHTWTEILAALPAETVIVEKTAFGCGDDAAFMEALQALDRKQIILCGLESHICVNQSAFQLQAAGFDVHVVEDAVGSRHSAHTELALRKFRHGGITPQCTEMVLFELMRHAGHPQFKTIQALIRSI